MAIHQSLYRIIYEDGFFVVIDHAGQRVSDLLETTGDAVAHAKELAIRDGSAQIVVQDRSGRVVSEFMHQREERPALREDDETDDSLFGSRPATRHSRPSHA